MRVIIVKQKPITTKKGEKTLMMDYIHPKTGATGRLFVNVADLDKFELPEQYLVDSEKLEDALKDFTTVDVEFDQSGYLIDLGA